MRFLQFVFLTLFVALGALNVSALPAASSPDTSTLIFLTPEQEIELALSAAPEHLRSEATVYVFGKKGYEKARSGALLFVGDGHAAQGDGELNGNALETSMDVEFTVTLIPNKRFNTPRVESDTEIMAVGLGGSLEDSLRAAIGSMSQWLEQDYGLTPSEIAQVLGTSVQLNINEVADRNAGVVAKLSKQRLAALRKT